MKDLQKIDSCEKQGLDYINYYLGKYNNITLFFTGTYCVNCKNIYPIIDSDNLEGNYIKIVIDDMETDEYMDFSEEKIKKIKIPSLLYFENGEMTEYYVGEGCCKDKLYSCDKNDDF